MVASVGTSTTRIFSSTRELIQELRQSWILVGYTVVLATISGNPPLTATGNAQQRQRQQQRALFAPPSWKRGPSAAAELNLSTCAALHLDLDAQTQDRLFDYLRTQLQLRSLDIRGSGSGGNGGGGNGGGGSGSAMMTTTMTVSLPHRSSSWSCISETQVALQVNPPSIHPLNTLS